MRSNYIRGRCQQARRGICQKIGIERGGFVLEQRLDDGHGALAGSKDDSAGQV
jgi:hypothetical protein